MGQGAERAWGTVVIVAVLSGCGLFPGTVPEAQAATIAVNSIQDASDPGKCILRNAILSANSNSSVGGCTAGQAYPTVDVINVGFSRQFCLFNGCTIILNSALPAVSEDVTINGVSNLMAISGANAYRIFDLQGVTVNISTLKLLNGYVTGAIVNSDSAGGAIRTSPNGTTLTLTNMLFSGNHAVTGGAIYLSSSTMVVTNTLFVGNTANSGGAIFQDGGVLIASGTTLSGNSAVSGGGLATGGNPDTRLTNVTISGNSALDNGGGIYRGNPFPSNNTVSLNNVTVTNNVADSDNNILGDGGGIYQSGGTTTVANSIIAGNLDSTSNGGFGPYPDCRTDNGGLFSQGHNLIGSGDGCSAFSNGVNADKVGTNANRINPRLAPLSANGGATDTHALLPASPAKNAGSPLTPGGGAFGACAATDQRGVARPVGPACDIGAFEAQPGPPFTDDPLTAGVPVKAVHIEELRSRINALRASFSLGPGSYTDPTITTGTTVVLAQHILDLRAALSAVYTAAGWTQPSYTDSNLAAGALIKAIHVTQIRNAVVAIE